MDPVQIGRTRAQATPSVRRMSQRFAAVLTQRLRTSREEFGEQLRGIARDLRPAEIRSFAATHTLRWAVNCAVAALVLSLPVAASAAAVTTAPTDAPAPVAAAAQGPRAQSLARGGTISAGRSPLTVNAEGARPIREYTLSKADTLGSLSNFFGVSPEAIAFANGITDPINLPFGKGIRIPPADGALFELAAGDTLESVAARFKVEAAVIKDYNRLHFEPEHFAPGKLLFVPGAVLPGLVYETADPEQESPAVVARASSPITQPAHIAQPAPAPRPAGGWPVAGVITQYMSAWHTGVDIAAPYGSSIVAVRGGVVSKAGWVPVGGLSVCVRSGAVENCYYHTGAVFVGVGQAVEVGQPVASIGMTGVTTGPHVHWETKVNGVFVNPLAPPQ